MKDQDNATHPAAITFSSVEGPLMAALGMLGFSMSMPATRLALESFGPVTVGLGRAAVAAVLALLWLGPRGALPGREAAGPLAVVAAGVVVGGPLLSALTLREVGASHGAIILGLAPTLTAAFAALRAGERPSAWFWAASLAGTAVIVAFGLARTHGAPTAADGLLLASVVLVALGYTEGGRLSREHGGARVICQALVLALPVTAPAGLWGLASEARPGPTTALSLAGFAYVAVISMLLAFFAWYRGLARFGVARASQVQLAQGPLGALWAHLLLGDALTASHGVTAAALIACAIAASRARVGQATGPLLAAPAGPAVRYGDARAR